MPAPALRALRFLAALYGVQTSYQAGGRRFTASAEALLATLRALGASCPRLEDAPPALDERRQQLWQRALPPVVVAWEGALPLLHVRVPAPAVAAPWAAHLTLESGETHRWQWPGADLPTREAIEVAGVRYVLKEVALPQTLPLGYHRLRLEISGQALSEALVIAAPTRAWLPPETTRRWGAFLPLYALRLARQGPGGSYLDLARLGQWIGAQGGNMVGTLPLLAALLSPEDAGPVAYGPYTAASRLLWNELYVDVAAAPELADCPAAQELIQSPAFRQAAAELRQMPLVDYRRCMAWQRQVLERLANCCFESETGRGEVQRFALSHPAVNDYARFRAVLERQGVPWAQWPERLRDGLILEGDFSESVSRYHLYAQWLAHRQMGQAAETCRAQGVSLYLDLPLGVDPAGYDVWRWRSLFVGGASVGAPPEPAYPQGQNWGFPPLHPEQLRRDGYRYFIACLRQQLAVAGVLRLDHVMGLHRLFWIPEGMDGRQGVYVRYPHEDFYAILALESHRYQTVIVGEDLGIVPPEVRPALRRHGLLSTYVAYFNLTGNSAQAIVPPPSHALACVNTHDLPTFAAYCQGLDLRQQLALGFHTPESAAREQAGRRAAVTALAAYLRQAGLLEGEAPGGQREPPDAQPLLAALLRYLARSDAQLLLVNLEDLWGETLPQNQPGTGPEQPNWRRKARYTFEEFSQLLPVTELLREVHRLRREANP